MYIDELVKIWKRYKRSDKGKEKVLEILKNGEDIDDLLGNDDTHFEESDILYETEVERDKRLEVFEDNGEQIK